MLSTGQPVPVVQNGVDTRDTDAAYAFVTDAYIGHRARFRVLAGGVNVWIRTASVGDLSTDVVRYGGIDYGGLTEPWPYVAGAVWRSGRGNIAGGGDDLALEPGDAFLLPYGVATQFDMRNSGMDLVRLPLHYLSEIAEETHGLPPGGLAFHSMAPVTAQLGHLWHTTQTFLHRLMANAGETLPGLLVDQYQRVAATTLLSAFPNTAMTAAHLPGPGRYRTPVIRRAIAYIDEHADEPVTVKQIADAVGISVRGLQAGFARLDTSPMDYLRRVRLAYAHQQLQAADPADGTTVAATAARWGFANPGRFTRAYTQLYGQSPAQTLRATS